AVALPALPQIAVPPAPTPAPPETAITAVTEHTPAPAIAVESYERLLMRHLNAHKRYPPAARARRQEGVVTIRFTMNREGYVLTRAIETSSRAAALDQEGLML